MEMFDGKREGAVSRDGVGGGEGVEEAKVGVVSVKLSEVGSGSCDTVVEGCTEGVEGVEGGVGSEGVLVVVV